MHAETAGIMDPYARYRRLLRGAVVRQADWRRKIGSPISDIVQYIRTPCQPHLSTSDIQQNSTKTSLPKLDLHHTHQPTLTHLIKMLKKIFTVALLLSASSGVLASPTKRGLGCPPGIPCGPGPVCTINDCEIEGCETAPVCTKRNAEPIIQPCSQICNAQGVCVCATAVKREPTPVNHPCPEICNEQGVCGCALESLIAKI
ncbi:hypothetical protein N7G274_001819 [Stereocaulon virgatum]|uniref:Uncharacterized protein n=1 Tax=Stereocaulon virgatum TaxID=373712 RepID=A0ABR4AKS9_9LECA